MSQRTRHPVCDDTRLSRWAATGVDSFLVMAT